jgi:hypothetical protein
VPQLSERARLIVEYCRSHSRTVGVRLPPCMSPESKLSKQAWDNNFF